MQIESQLNNAHAPAFPGLDNYMGETTGSYQGMTKREYFAIELMRELIAMPEPPRDNGELQDIAKYSVHCADCLIRALEAQTD